ncbi:MAG: hypothetical protein H6907_06990 [Hyphomicrobiales bacterium]|nr:hypothetical protein [Hyphomicrobiales bacterium]
MPSFLEHPLTWAVALPFMVAALGIWVLRRAGGGRAAGLAGAAVGAGYLLALVTAGGLPPFPPPAGVGALFYLVALGLVLGMVLDHFRDRPLVASPLLRVLLLGAHVLLCAWWSLGAPLAGAGTARILSQGLPLALGGLVVALRLRHVAAQAAPAHPAIMVMVAALGLAALAALADSPPATGIAIALAAAVAGHLAWNWPGEREPFSDSVLFVAAGALVVLAVRVGWHTATPLWALPVLAMAFFADTPAQRLWLRWRRVPEPFYPFVLLAVCLVSLALAAAIAWVGVDM